MHKAGLKSDKDKTKALWKGPYMDSMKFCSLGAATAFSYHIGARIRLLNEIRGVAEALVHRGQDAPAANVVYTAAMESLRWSRLTCQGLECFQGDSADKKVGKLTALFPFDAAWATF